MIIKLIIVVIVVVVVVVVVVVACVVYQGQILMRKSSERKERRKEEVDEGWKRLNAMIILCESTTSGVCGIRPCRLRTRFVPKNE